MDDNLSDLHQWLGWAPSGDALNVGDKLLRLNANERPSCELSDYLPGMFVRNDLVIALHRKDVGYPTWSISRFTFFDASCEPEGNWDVPENWWYIVDVATDRGLLSILRSTEVAQTENLIVDLTARNVLRRWPENSGTGGYFADRGRAICNTNDSDLADRRPVSCWDVDTGSEIAKAPNINGGNPMAVAQRASRIVASDYTRKKIPFFYEFRDILKRRVLWDFRSGKEILSWRPRFQSWEYQLFIDSQKPPKHVSDAFRFAISPDGQYVVEGGSGGIHLYKIEL